MNRLTLTNFSLRHPWWLMILVLAGTAFFAAQMPKVHFDNDPENMLSPDEPARVFHHQVKERYDLYDFVVVGVVNTVDENGVFNVETLQRIDDLTQQLISLHQTEDGRPAVITPPRGERPAQTVLPSLHPEGAVRRFLAKVFSHDPEKFFDEEGRSAIIAREIISPSVVDNIKQAELGQLKIEYLMEEPPTTTEEALALREEAMSNPLYKGTLVAEDGKAMGLYIPIVDKAYSYNVANLIGVLTSNWPDEDQVFITGLPVAEDTFGTEMLVQMATSAPMAMVVIFVLLLLFFRRLSLVVPPVALAMVTVICTMGLLIAQGFDVHIMSSMIAIFLMPIAVADSVHVLSEFYDTYPRFNNKIETVRDVVGHLFRPMLFTSLTTMAGFGSLALTPIPPVRIFGLHVAFGVGLAWLLTMTMIPACIVLFVSEKSLAKSGAKSGVGSARRRRSSGPLVALLAWVSRFTYQQWKLVLAATLVLMAVAGYGISKIQVNDNPVKWFAETHRIRVADEVLNRHFGGTYTAYLTLAPEAQEEPSLDEALANVKLQAEARFQTEHATQLQRLVEVLEQTRPGTGVFEDDLARVMHRLSDAAEEIDSAAGASWVELGDALLYLDPDGLTSTGLATAVRRVSGAEDADKAVLLEELLQAPSRLGGSALQDFALSITDRFTETPFRDFVYEMETQISAPPFKRPEVLRWVEDLQTHLLTTPRVGKTNSAVDALKKASFELNYRSPVDVAPPGTDLEERNQSFYSVPDSTPAIAQVFTQLEGMKKKDSLFHLVTRDYKEANIWVQLTSGDNSDMETVVDAVEEYRIANPPPAGLQLGWAGLTYINVVWQQKMVVGMLGALVSSFFVVLVMMMVLFRSPLFGALAMIPLTVTISLIYGLIGLVGKDYDMPVAVLSALTLGLSVDFAIHFLQRSREMVRTKGSWKAAIEEMFKEPAMAISRNAIIISIGFTPLLVAPLVPYKTVGFFLATIMVVSWMATMFLLAALATMLEKTLFKKELANREVPTEGGAS